MAVSLCNDLLFLIRQFFDEEKLLKTAHTLEQEASFYFDMNYFESLVLDGEWKNANEYMSGFCGVHDNKYSVKIYFELRKQQYLEALDKHDAVGALDILMKDLKVFESSNPELYREMTILLSMDDFRKHHLLSSYGDVISARKRLMDEIKLVIEANPQFDGKLELPQFEKSRLRRLINQSLNWQHVNCANPLPEPRIETLFTDHRCLGSSNIQITPTLQSMSAPVIRFPAELVLGESSVPESSITTVNLGNLSNVDSIISAPAVDNRNSSKEDVTFGGIKDSGKASKICSGLPVNQSISSIPNPCQSLNIVPDGFPKAVERIMQMSSMPTSMEFHPFKHTFLLVGNRNGEIELWDICSEVKMFWNAFTIWRREAISTLLLKDFDKDSQILVNRVSWSPDGSVFGVAFSRNIVQLYSYHSMTNYTEKQLEIEAHLGSVNDVVFSSPDDQLLVITCGDDKFIQVWNAMTGSKQFTFEGHGAPVYSLYAHRKKDIDFLLSTSTNGEIRVWLYDHSGPKVQFDAPGRCCVRMAYSDDSERIFSCGTNVEGDSFIVEWNDIEGHIIRVYTGLSRSSVGGIVQFCTNKSRFLAAGDEHLIKIWDTDRYELLAVLDADGGLPARPHLSFNRECSILAVFADHNKIKILANDAGRLLLQTSRCGSGNLPGFLSQAREKVFGPNLAPITRTGIELERITSMEEENKKIQVRFELNKVLGSQKCSKIVEVSRCRSLMLPTDLLKTNKVSRLTYTHSGNGILALGEDGIHLLWRWLANNGRQASTSYVPRLWQPNNGLQMMNDVHGNGSKPCLALSKNDSYVASSSGKLISLFNAITFKKIKTCMPSPPSATCVGFYPPDNNILAIGLDDSTILVYNVRQGEVIKRLEGHVRRISGFAFSNTMEVLVSCGVDTQIIVWGYGNWEKKNITLLQISSGWMPSETSETYVQFYGDELHFLAVHETQLAVYEATKLERVKQWTIGDFCTRISHAALSCDNQLVYAVMKNGIVLILSASDLSPRLEIDPSVYLPAAISFHVCPLVVSSHPKKPDQIALGLSNGGVVILEPEDPRGTWVVQPPVSNGILPNRPNNL